MRPSLMPTTLVRFLPRVLLLGALLATAGCLFRMPIQQGNFLDATQIAQLETGMTRSQVAFLLGTPMIPSGFDADRWDYYFSLKARGIRKPVTRKLTVYFVDDKVSRAEQGPDSIDATVRQILTPATTPAG